MITAMATALVLSFLQPRVVTVEPKATEILMVQGAVAVGGFLLGCSIHEGAHGTVGHLVGNPPRKFTLYPATRNGRFTYCSTSFTYPTDEDGSGFLIHAAPYLFDATWLTFYSGVVLTGGTEPLPLEARSILVVFSTVFLIDFINGAWKNGEFTDIQRTFNSTHTPELAQEAFRTAMLTASAVWATAIVIEEVSILTNSSQE